MFSSCDKGGGGGYSSRRTSGRDKYGPPVRTEFRLIVENLSSRCSWQDLKVCAIDQNKSYIKVSKSRLLFLFIPESQVQCINLFLSVFGTDLFCWVFLGFHETSR